MFSSKCVGLLIPSKCQLTIPFLEAVNQLVTSTTDRQCLAKATQDDRVSLVQWHDLLENELLNLFGWALKRLILTQQADEHIDMVPKRTLSLMPGYGLALHILRRAVPFAALGIPTTCGFPLAVKDEAQNIVRILADALSLTDLLTYGTQECSQLVEQIKEPNDFIVITGRIATAHQIRNKVTARVIACTGCCGVLVGLEEESVLKIAKLLEAVALPNSCSRLSAAFTCNNFTPSSSVKCVYGNSSTTEENSLAKILCKLHPSVVYVAKGKDSSEMNVPKYIAGYRLIPYTDDGIPTESLGFSSDPLFGWPGDYLL